MIGCIATVLRWCQVADRSTGQEKKFRTLDRVSQPGTVRILEPRSSEPLFFLSKRRAAAAPLLRGSATDELVMGNWMDYSDQFVSKEC
jgi:hypothetical protein